MQPQINIYHHCERQTGSRFIYLFLLTQQASQPWSVAERHRKTGVSGAAILQRWMADSQDYSPVFLFPIQSSLALSPRSHTHTQTKGTSAITPEITSLIDISITLRHSGVLSCLAHAPPAPIRNRSMNAQTGNGVTLLFCCLVGFLFHALLSVSLLCVPDFPFSSLFVLNAL